MVLTRTAGYLSKHTHTCSYFSFKTNIQTANGYLCQGEFSDILPQSEHLDLPMDSIYRSVQENRISLQQVHIQKEKTHRHQLRESHKTVYVLAYLYPSSVPRLYITYIMIYIHIYVMNRLGTEEDLYRKTTSLHGSICPNNVMLTSQNVNFIVESCRVFVYENIQHSPGTSEMLCFILAPSKYIWSPLGISIF